jgi:hypothetical protein
VGHDADISERVEIVLGHRSLGLGCLLLGL